MSQRCAGDRTHTAHDRGGTLRGRHFPYTCVFPALSLPGMGPAEWQTWPMKHRRSAMSHLHMETLPGRSSLVQVLFLCPGRPEFGYQFHQWERLTLSWSPSVGDWKETHTQCLLFTIHNPMSSKPNGAFLTLGSAGGLSQNLPTCHSGNRKDPTEAWLRSGSQ